MKRPRDRDPHHHTRAITLEDGRDARDLSSTENADLCAGCVRCCSYITVEVDAPRAAWEYDQWIWALEHDRVSLYVEKPERWYVHFETTCRHLNAQGRCAIHGRHPVLCREYDPRVCERRLPTDEVAWFSTGDDLERWIAARRPAHYRRLLAYRRDSAPGPPVADVEADAHAARSPGGLIAIGESAPARPSNGATAHPVKTNGTPARRTHARPARRGA